MACITANACSAFKASSSRIRVASHLCGNGSLSWRWWLSGKRKWLKIVFPFPPKKDWKSPDKYQCFKHDNWKWFVCHKKILWMYVSANVRTHILDEKKIQILGARTIRSLKETTKKSGLFCPSFSSGKRALYTLEKKPRQSPWNNPPKKMFGMKSVSCVPDKSGIKKGVNKQLKTSAIIIQGNSKRVNRSWGNSGI